MSTSIILLPSSTSSDLPALRDQSRTALEQQSRARASREGKQLAFPKNRNPLAAGAASIELIAAGEAEFGGYTGAGQEQFHYLKGSLVDLYV
ncbi:MAG: hypothetical protein HYX75_06110 [Acidobacteria bacterium]|nr:hypothetical protein [Acidobacteriota bacterium]